MQSNPNNLIAIDSQARWNRAPKRPMTEEQRAAAQEIVARYDAASMGIADRRAMRSELQDAGIRPGKELGEILRDNGFKPGGPYDRPNDASNDTKTPESDARIQRLRDAPTGSMIRRKPQAVREFQQRAQEAQPTPEDFERLTRELQEGGYSLEGNFVDAYV